MSLFGSAQIHDDGQDHGVALDLFVDEAVQLILDAVFDAGPVAAFNAVIAGDDGTHQHWFTVCRTHSIGDGKVYGPQF